MVLSNEEFVLMIECYKCHGWGEAEFLNNAITFSFACL